MDDPNRNDPGVTAASSPHDIALSIVANTKDTKRFPGFTDALKRYTAAKLRDLFPGTTVSRLYRDATTENKEIVRNKLCRAIKEARLLVELEEQKEGKGAKKK